jgi:transposase
MVHVGVDLHKSFSQVAVLEDSGEIREYRLSHEGMEVEEFFRGLPRARVAIEATGTWWWLVDLLEGMGHEPVLSHPKQTKAIASARLKNDRVDAERLASLCRGGLLPTVWIPPQEVREAREFLRHRLGLVWQRTKVKNRLTSLMARRNLRPTKSRTWYSQRGEAELRELALSPTAGRIRDDTLMLLRTLDDQIHEVEQQLFDRWADDPRVRRLETIPGIGPLTAIGLVVELGDIHRFPSAKHLASYVGLTPRVRASGGRVHSGHISKEGNRLLRWMFVAAATQAVRYRGPLRAWHRRISRRKGKKIARVGLARKLTEIVYHVWRDEIDYRAFHCRTAVRG